MARSGNHIQNDGAKKKPSKANAPTTIIASIVQTTPKRAASGVASGAAAIEASPATAVLRPIIEAEWPRLSRMTLSSGMATPMAMPTTLIEAMAAEIDSQCVRWSAAASSLEGAWFGMRAVRTVGPAVA